MCYLNVNVMFCFKVFLEVFQAKTFIFGFPNAYKPFQSCFFNHKTHAEHTPYTYTPTKHDFRHLIFSEPRSEENKKCVTRGI